MALLTFGENWHNDHHAYPTSSRHGLKWYEIDVNWYGIWTFKLLGLAKQIKVVELPKAPNILGVAPVGLPVSFSTMNPNLPNAYSEQANVEIEQQIGQRSTLSIGYEHLRGVHLIASVNLNVPTCLSSVDPVNLCRPVAGYQNDKQYSPAADSLYNALLISFVQRPVKWGSFRVSYAYSKAFDDVSEFFFSAPLNNYNIHQDWGRSDDDQRHRVVFDATIHSSTTTAHNAWEHLSHGFRLSGVLQYYSALPFNIITGAANIQTTTSRPCVGLAGNAAACANNIANMIGRNTGIGFNTFSMNVRLSRTFSVGEIFHVEAIAEAFNALNHVNDLVPNTTFGLGVYPTSPSAILGTPTQVGIPRTVQLALRATF